MNTEKRSSLAAAAILTVATFIFAGGWVAAAKPSILLIEHGQPRATIIYATDADNFHRDAALELNETLKRISGIFLPVVRDGDKPDAAYVTEIHIGQTGETLRLIDEHKLFLCAPLEDYAADDFAWASFAGQGKNYIFILAQPRPNFTEGGAKFGVRAFAENYLGVRWYLPGDDPQSPGDYWSYYPQSKTVTIAPIPQMDCGVPPIRPAFQSRALSGVNLVAFPEDVQWFNRNRLAPRYDVTHNEAQIHGNAPDQHIVFGDAKNRSIARQKVIEFFKHRPDKLSVSLGINDSLKYQAQDFYPSGSLSTTKAVFEYTNFAAAGRPDKIVTQFAYQRTEDATNSPVLADNVIPYLTMDTTFWVDPVFRQRDEVRIEGWAAKSKNLGLYDYAYGAPMLIPRFDPQIVGESLQRFYSAAFGKRGYYAEAYPNWALDGFKNYIVAKLLWNPDLKPQSMIKEFCEHMFAGGAADMLRYFRELQRLWVTRGTQTLAALGGPGSIRQNINQLALVSPEQIDHLLRILAEAKMKAGADRYACARIETMETQWKYIRAWSQIYDRLSQLGALRNFNYQSEKQARLVEEFVQTARDLAERPDLASISTLQGLILKPRVTEDYRMLMNRYIYDPEAFFSNALGFMDELADEKKWPLAEQLSAIARGVKIGDDDLSEERLGVALRYLDRVGKTIRYPFSGGSFQVDSIDDLKKMGWHTAPAFIHEQAVVKDPDPASKSLMLWGTDRRQGGSNYIYHDFPALHPDPAVRYLYCSLRTNMERTVFRPGHSRLFVQVIIDGQQTTRELSTTHYNTWFQHTCLLAELPPGARTIRLEIFATDQFDSRYEIQPGVFQTKNQSDRVKIDDIELGLASTEDLYKLLTD